MDTYRICCISYTVYDMPHIIGVFIILFADDTGLIIKYISTWIIIMMQLFSPWPITDLELQDTETIKEVPPWPHNFSNNPTDVLAHMPTYSIEPALSHPDWLLKTNRPSLMIWSYSPWVVIWFKLRINLKGWSRLSWRWMVLSPAAFRLDFGLGTWSGYEKNLTPDRGQ